MNSQYYITGWDVMWWWRVNNCLLISALDRRRRRHLKPDRARGSRKTHYLYDAFHAKQEVEMGNSKTRLCILYTHLYRRPRFWIPLLWCTINKPQRQKRHYRQVDMSAANTIPNWSSASLFQEMPGKRGYVSIRRRHVQTIDAFALHQYSIMFQITAEGCLLMVSVL